MVFHRGHPVPQIVAFAGPSGPAFSFSAFLLPARPLACVDGAGFLSSRFAAVLDSFTTGSHGPNRAGLLLGHTGASLDFLPRTSLPLPLKGEGLGIIFLGFVGLALLVHNWVTLAQQGRSGRLLVSVPLSGLQYRTQGHTGPSLDLSPFSPSLSRRQSCQLPLQVVVDSFLDGPDGELQGAVSHLAGFGAHLCWLHLDELLVLQLSYVFRHGVGAHPSVLADLPNAGPALVGFPVLTENQVGV